MIQPVKKTLVLKQYDIGFSQFYGLHYKHGLRISVAGCGMRKTEQEYLVVYSWHKFASLEFFLKELLCAVLAGKQQITTKCRYLYKFISKSLKCK